MSRNVQSIVIAVLASLTAVNIELVASPAFDYADYEVREMMLMQANPLFFLSPLPRDQKYDCSIDIDDVPWPNVRARTSFCQSPAVTINRTQVLRYSSCGGNSYVRTFTASDLCGREISYSYVVDFTDSKPPTLTVAGDTTIQCGEDIPKPSYEVSDNCSENPKVSIEETKEEQNPCEYTITRTYTARDGCNNKTKATQLIIVQDHEAPTVTLTNPMLEGIEHGGSLKTYNCNSPSVALEDAKFADCCPAPLIIEAYDKLLATGVCDLFGYYRRWECGYIVSDEAGNTNNFKFYIDQYDTIPPQLEGVPEDLELQCDDTIPPAAAIVASDNCRLDGSVSLDQDTFGIVAPGGAYAIKRTWTVADRCGNLSSSSQTISFCDFVDIDSASIEIETETETETKDGISERFRERDTRDEMRVFPNPTTGLLSIEHSLNGEINLALVDHFGKRHSLRTRIKDNSGLVELDLTSFPNGLYYLQLSTLKESRAFRIVKQE